MAWHHIRWQKKCTEWIELREAPSSYPIQLQPVLFLFPSELGPPCHSSWPGCSNFQDNYPSLCWHWLGKTYLKGLDCQRSISIIVTILIKEHWKFCHGQDTMKVFDGFKKRVQHWFLLWDSYLPVVQTPKSQNKVTEPDKYLPLPSMQVLRTWAPGGHGNWPFLFFCNLIVTLPSFCPSSIVSSSLFPSAHLPSHFSFVHFFSLLFPVSITVCLCTLCLVLGAWGVELPPHR